MEGAERLPVVNSLPFLLRYGRRSFNRKIATYVSVNQLLISVQGSIRWESPQMDS